MKKYLVVLLASVLLASQAALADLRIGVSIPAFDDVYFNGLRGYLADKAKADGGVQLQFEDARLDVVRQLSQVETFITQKVDAIIVCPVDTAATRTITEAASRAGIPLVYMNRKPDEAKLPANTVTVISDDFEGGRLQAQYIVDRLGGKGRVAIMMGELTNNAAQFRTQSAKEVFARYPQIRIVEQQSGFWLRDKGLDLASNWLLAGKTFDAIIANNDEMAIGAAMALRQAGKSGVLVAGLDGTADGVAAVKKGMLAASVFQDAKGQAEGSLTAAVQMANKQPGKDILIPYRLITADNASQFH